MAKWNDEQALPHSTTRLVNLQPFHQERRVYPTGNSFRPAKMHNSRAFRRNRTCVSAFNDQPDTKASPKRLLPKALPRAPPRRTVQEQKAVTHCEAQHASGASTEIATSNSNYQPLLPLTLMDPTLDQSNPPRFRTGGQLSQIPRHIAQIQNLPQRVT